MSFQWVGSILPGEGVTSFQIKNDGKSAFITGLSSSIICTITTSIDVMDGAGPKLDGGDRWRCIPIAVHCIADCSDLNILNTGTLKYNDTYSYLFRVNAVFCLRLCVFGALSYWQIGGARNVGMCQTTASRCGWQ